MKVFSSLLVLLLFSQNTGAIKLQKINDLNIGRLVILDKALIKIDPKNGCTLQVLSGYVVDTSHQSQCAEFIVTNDFGKRNKKEYRPLFTKGKRKGNSFEIVQLIHNLPINRKGLTQENNFLVGGIFKIKRTGREKHLRISSMLQIEDKK